MPFRVVVKIIRVNLIWKVTCTPVFIAALFTIAKTWKQCKHPSAGEWIKKIWYIYVHMMEHYSAIKMSVRLPFIATWINLEIIIRSDISHLFHSGKYYIMHMWNIKKNNTSQLIHKIDSQRKRTYGYQRRKGRGTDSMGLMDTHCYV